MIETASLRRVRTRRHGVSARLRERGVALREGAADRPPLRARPPRSPRSPRGSSRGRGSPTRAARPRCRLSTRTCGVLPPPAADVHAPARAEQLDDAHAAVVAETDERTRLVARAAARPRAVRSRRRRRALYHAGAAIASNYLVTLHRVASELFEAAGAPAAGLAPLMRRTIDNGFELTGPISRGDWATVERHREAIRGPRPSSRRLRRAGALDRGDTP